MHRLVPAALAATLAAALLAAGATSAAPQGNRYTVTPLASDIPGLAPVTDANLKNTWGLARGPATPWWIANNATASTSVYTSAGTRVDIGGIQTIGDRVFVTYGKQQPGSDDEAHGRGLGIVDAYDLDGHFLGRVAQHGQLNAPWGLAMAPASFGRFGGDLLVGNFGDGQINAYKEMPNGHFVHRGTLHLNHRKLSIDGLWALEFGNAGLNGDPQTLFFTAGLNDEADGLFGAITPAS